MEQYHENNPDKVIVVHCTHGYNRTGLIVCSYLCKYQGMTLNDAVVHFKKHRPNVPSIPYHEPRAFIVARLFSSSSPFSTSKCLPKTRVSTTPINDVSFDFAFVCLFDGEAFGSSSERILLSSVPFVWNHVNSDSTPWNPSFLNVNAFLFIRCSALSRAFSSESESVNERRKGICAFENSGGWFFWRSGSISFKQNITSGLQFSSVMSFIMHSRMVGENDSVKTFSRSGSLSSSLCR